MIKRILIFLIFILFPGIVFSQISIGLKTGLNLSYAKYSDKDADVLVKPYRKLKPGFVSGIVLNSKLNKVLSVQTEVLYSQKGLKFEQLPYNKIVNTMNYIELPISGHYNFSARKDASFNFYIGAYAAYWIDGKFKKDDLTSGEKFVDTVDFDNPEYKFNRLDAGILAGIVYKVKKTSFFLRYTHSMTGSSELNVDALTNRIVSFGINLFFID